MDSVTVRSEDLLPVGTRVSWGAIFAGAVLALAVYLVLTLLGGAIGLSVSDNVRADNLATGGAIWAIFATALALFVGGIVTSQCTVGENKTEAVVHSVIMWGVVFAMLLWLMASGVRAGFNLMVGMTDLGQVATRNMTGEDWEAAARRSGVTQEQLAEWRTRAANAPAEARAAVTDPQNRQAVSEAATRASWWTLAGTLLSMATAVFGGLVGAGPSMRQLTIGLFPSQPVYHRPHAAVRS